MQVDAAIYVVDKMCEAGFMPSSQEMQSVLEICSETNQDFQVLYILRRATSLFFFSFFELYSNPFLRTICCVG